MLRRFSQTPIFLKHLVGMMDNLALAERMWQLIKQKNLQYVCLN